MRIARKGRELYKVLSGRIRNGALPPGSLLPREVELAGELGVARDTLRTALRELEADGLIRRVRGQGTFVAELDRPLTVTYLLPCADYEAVSGISSRRTHSEMIFGLMQEAVNHNCKIEAIPLTATNEPKDINWKLLEDLNAGSRVVLSGSWFKEIFPFLLERQCRVGIILHEYDDFSRYTDHWQVWRLANRYRVRLLAERLELRGCRDIVRTRLPDDAQSPAGIREVVCGANIAEIRRAVAAAEKFDALILDNMIIAGIDNRMTINRNLGLPEGIKVALADRNCFDDAVIRRTLSAFFPYQEIAREILASLAAARYTPSHQTVNAQIQEETI